MTLFSIAFAYLRAKKSQTLLHGCVMALGVALMTALLLFGNQMKERLYRDGAGIDVVIGAKGSPLQLILSSIQHMDIPTGNIPLSEAERLKKHPQIKQLIPISLGDSYQQFRIVGSTPEYLAHFNAALAQGKIWGKSMQAVIGARVAEASGLKLGDKIVGSHGMVPGAGDHHADHPYIVTGILQPTGTVLDRLIVTSLESVWDVHSDTHHDQEHADHAESSDNDHHDDHHAEAEHLEHADEPHDHEEHKKHHHDENHDEDAHEKEHHDHDEHKTDTHHDDREVTALLVQYRSHIAAFSFPRIINKETSMQAASPAFEMARLLDLIGIGTDSAMLIAGFLVAVALANVLLSLVNNIRDRRYDLAIFRTLGASKRNIMLLVIIEGMVITVIGSLVGLALGHGFIEAIGHYTSKGADIGLTGWRFYHDIWLIWGALMVLSLLACLIPAWEAYKTDIRQSLTHV